MLKLIQNTGVRLCEERLRRSNPDLGCANSLVAAQLLLTLGLLLNLCKDQVVGFTKYWIASAPSGASQRRTIFTNVLNLIVYIVLLTCSGCGFTPLHGKHNEQTLNSLAQIKINPIEYTIKTQQARHIGTKLSHILEDMFNPSNHHHQSLYSLELKLNQTSQPLAIQTKGEAIRYRNTIHLSYVLSHLHTKHRITSGKFFVSGSYEVSLAEFANFSSSATAIDDNLLAVAEELKIRMIHTFSKVKQ
jgi:hypothetical protein